MEARSDATRVGIVRSYESPVELHSASQTRLEQAQGGRLTWTAGFESPGAGGVRLLVESVRTPPGTLGFVYSEEGEVHGPYDIGGEIPREVWTNAVFAERVYLEIQFPFGAVDPSEVGVTVSTLAHLEHEDFAPPRGLLRSRSESLASCFEDMNCVVPDEWSSLEDASRAIAQISYREGSAFYVCTGGLLNTTAGTAIPYFLTANHCVSNEQSAASVEAYWDYRTLSCGGEARSKSGLARSLGATLLATGSRAKGDADYTLLRLNQTPPQGRYYLGWSAMGEPVAGGATLYRIAHPDGGPQSYSSHRVSTVPSPGACDGLPTTRFIYSKTLKGATKGGSSGSPVFVRDGLKVVGQLFGRCGRNLDDACDSDSNSSVDGSFATYFEDVRQWLDPPRKARCAPNAVTLCLAGERFRVEVVARDPRSGRGVTGTAIPQNDVFGYFSLPELTGQIENPEVFVKVVDGRELNGKFWIFYGGLTDLEFVLHVTDVETGAQRIYRKDAGGYCGSSDTDGF